MAGDWRKCMNNKVQLTLACGDYEIVRALKEGKVEPTASTSPS